MAGVRFLLAGLILAGFIAATRGFKATKKQWRDNAITGGFLCLGGNGLVCWSEQKVPSGIATSEVEASMPPSSSPTRDARKRPAWCRVRCRKRSPQL